MIMKTEKEINGNKLLLNLPPHLIVKLAVWVVLAVLGLFVWGGQLLDVALRAVVGKMRNRRSSPLYSRLCDNAYLCCFHAMAFRLVTQLLNTLNL